LPVFPKAVTDSVLKKVTLEFSTHNDNKDWDTRLNVHIVNRISEHVAQDLAIGLDLFQLIAALLRLLQLLAKVLRFVLRFARGFLFGGEQVLKFITALARFGQFLFQLMASRLFFPENIFGLAGGGFRQPAEVMRPTFGMGIA
jgi:hypothetical protein